MRSRSTRRSSTAAASSGRRWAACDHAGRRRGLVLHRRCRFRTSRWSRSLRRDARAPHRHRPARHDPGAAVLEAGLPLCSQVFFLCAPRGYYVGALVGMLGVLMPVSMQVMASEVLGGGANTLGMLMTATSLGAVGRHALSRLATNGGRTRSPHRAGVDPLRSGADGLRRVARSVAVARAAAVDGCRGSW